MPAASDGAAGSRAPRAVAFIAPVHARLIHDRRVRALVEHLTPLIPRAARVLDVGCGDGLLARQLMDRRPDVAVGGIDVLVRPDAQVPVEHFDGRRIPHPDASFDVVMFVDVLHHTEDAPALLREARRVARRAVVLKDHLRDGFLAGPTLRLMDWVGNAPHGVSLPYNYLSRAQWASAFAESGLTVETWTEGLGLYPWPASLLFERGLHFVSRLCVARGDAHA